VRRFEALGKDKVFSRLLTVEIDKPLGHPALGAKIFKFKFIVVYMSCKKTTEKKIYKNPIPVVDIIIQNGDKILLIRRRKEPSKSRLAFPGGFVEWGEKVEDAALREVKEETGLDVKIIDLLGVYSDPLRDPRGHLISIVFVAENVGGELKAGDDAIEVMWFDLEELEESDLCFDHWKILQDYLKWRKNKGTYWSSK